MVEILEAVSKGLDCCAVPRCNTATQGAFCESDGAAGAGSGQGGESDLAAWAEIPLQNIERQGGQGSIVGHGAGTEEGGEGGTVGISSVRTGNLQ